MPIAQSLLPEFDQEMANTRKVIGRVPNGKSDWRPHVKSMPLGYLAVHVSTLPHWVKTILEQDELDVGKMASSGWKMPDFESAEASVQTFDKMIEEARGLLSRATDEHLLKTWTLKNNDVTVFAIPRVAALRTMVFNHLIHHRAQLSVYLRLNDVPLPGLYGPTADEPM